MGTVNISHCTILHYTINFVSHVCPFVLHRNTVSLYSTSLWVTNGITTLFASEIITRHSLISWLDVIVELNIIRFFLKSNTQPDD